MRPRWVYFGLLVFAFSRPAHGDTTLDVSKEWNAHKSSSAEAVSERNAAPVAESTAALAAEEAACKCDPMTVQERLEDATYAFTAYVLEAPGPKKGKRVVTFDVDEIFKGTPKEEMKVSAEVAGDGCDINYDEGQKYLVYAKWEWGNTFTARCMGTKLLTKTREDLGPNQALKDKLYEKLHNACMGRLDTMCCLASLKVMRASYDVPEPEAGCPSGTVPDRLHCGGSYTWCIPFSEKTHQ